MSLHGARTEHIGRHDDGGLSLLDPLNLLDLLQNEIGECGQVRNLDKGDNIEGPGNSMRHLHTLDLRDRLQQSWPCQQPVASEHMKPASTISRLCRRLGA